MRWQEYKDIDDATLLKILPLILKCNSLSWYNSLTDTVRENMDQFKTAFQQRFYPSDVEKLRGFSEIWKRVQKPNESVDEFVTALQKIKRVYQNLSDENLRSALTLGFLPHIKRHVIESNANTLDGILQAARVAEQAAAATSDDDQNMQTALSRIEQRLVNSNSQRDRSLSPIDGNDGQSRSSSHDFFTPPSSRSPSASGYSEIGHSDFRQPKPQYSYCNSGTFQFLGRRPLFANAATRCYNCGKVGHISKFCRKARKVCYTCGMPGHLQRQCRAARPNLN